MTEHHRIYLEGEQAFNDGQPSDSNPYFGTPESFDDWKQGWYKAQEDSKRVFCTYCGFRHAPLTDCLTGSEPECNKTSVELYRGNTDPDSEPFLLYRGK